jgi:hypothetical protein
MSDKAAELRAQADRNDQLAEASFQRSDTDGFLSQWALGITARKLRLEADLAEAGGKAEFSALFDLEGNLVAAKIVKTVYGQAFALLASDDPRSRFRGWFNPSLAKTAERRRANDAKRGFYVGTVRARARAEIAGEGRGLSGAASAYVTTIRTDGGFSRDVEIVDNGH